MFPQTSQISAVLRKELIIILAYLDKLPQIKTRLTKSMSKHMKFCKLRVTFQTSNRLKTDLASKNLFLEHYSQVLFIHFQMETAKPPTLLRPTDISK